VVRRGQGGRGGGRRAGGGGFLPVVNDTKMQRLFVWLYYMF